LQSLTPLLLLQDQPMIFTDGGAFTWRNGDTADAATGVKCMIEQATRALVGFELSPDGVMQGGVPAGNPQDAVVQTSSWNYVW
jgi:hypothetical protein